MLRKFVGAFSFARKIKGTSLVAEPQQQLQIKKIQQDFKELSEQFQSLSQENVQAERQRVRAIALKDLSYEGEDPSPNKLVNRPAKGATWGLGGQLVLAQRKVQLQGVRDDPQEITKFLELLQVKNIYIHDWKSLQQKDLNRKRYSILGSCFSAKHCWRTGIQLKNAFNRHMLLKKRGRNRRVETIMAMMNGSKDDQWSLVEYKDFQVHLMTEEQRQAVDLQWKWNNPVSEEVIQKHVQMDLNKKRRRSQFQRFQ